MKKCITVVLACAWLVGCVAAEGDNESKATDELAQQFGPGAQSLTMNTDGWISIDTNDGTGHHDCYGGYCQFAYLTGATITLYVVNPNDPINCVRFSKWTGACAGQGRTCTLTMNSDLLTDAQWPIQRGCSGN